MNKYIFPLALLATLTLSGCARREEAEPEPAITPAQSTAPQTEEEQEKLVPKATIAPVTVHVTLSPQAQALLKSKGEKVLIDATYAGDPRASEQAQKMADQLSGMVKLGENKRTLDAAGAVTFDDDVIDKSRTDFIVGEVQLTVNVTSAKTAVSENLLACPFYWKTLAEASKENIQIACTTFAEVKE
jgi:hypothetical protein